MTPMDIEAAVADHHASIIFEKGWTDWATSAPSTSALRDHLDRFGGPSLCCQPNCPDWASVDSALCRAHAARA